jgi:acetyl-CoA carboxylase carboxyl transferase alpha subunit/acetyl-CoA carboxylase carboxyl transferase beta subunit
MRAVSAEARIGQLFDEFEPNRGRSRSRDPIEFPGYREAVRATASAGEADEAVMTGIASIDGHKAVAAVFEFSFLGGSMGIEAGRRLDAAMRTAARIKIPFIAVTSTGGARMQEGMAALAQMPRTVAASLRLKSRGVPRITVLCHPTTGGVYASFASLADFIVAEKDATVGFAGPRVAESVAGERLPAGSHTAAAAYRAGLSDALLEPDQIKSWLARLLRILGTENPSIPPRRNPPAPRRAKRSAWQTFEVARHPARPSPRDYVNMMFEEVIEIRGDRIGAEDAAVLCCVGLLDGIRIAVVAIDRASPVPAGFRKAQRTIDLAASLELPILTLIDTPGADPRSESEYQGLAGEIARTFESLLGVKTPVVSVVTGEGGSGGALSLACGDVVLTQENAVFSVTSPESAATILHRDASRAQDVADQLKPTAAAMLGFGYADRVVAEPPGGAHANPRAAAEILRASIVFGFKTARGSVSLRARRWR